MATGTVKFFKEDKGFGFVRGEDGNEFFFHISNVKTTGTIPAEGAAVTFSRRPGKKGEEAYDIVLVDAEGSISVMKTDSHRPTARSAHSQQQQSQAPSTHPHRAGGSNHETFPYTFAQRPADFVKKAPEQLHDHLNAGCYDIAFEVEWRALTPVAANPCSDPTAGTSHPTNNDSQYQGYDKRWLMVDGRLALSPFTVKSAVANGFASLLGSCYRVEQEVVEHRPEPETFQCTGAWRRYRVPREKSKPGILEHFDRVKGEVAVMPVTEFFWDEIVPPRGVTFTPGQEYEVSYESQFNKNIITGLGRTGSGKVARVIYYGPYRFGMNLTFGPGEFNKHHYHRFYRTENKQPLTGKVNLLNLEPLDQQKKKVFMGVFKKFGNTNADQRIGLEKQAWHQDLGPGNPDFQPGKWVYYQAYKDDKDKDIITAIGLNFQFKTAFHLHDDAVPPAQQECTDLDHLCPRCAMFGITTKDGNEAVGLRGRFKASTLTGPEIIDGGVSSQQLGDVKITLHRWLDKKGETEVASQVLLPIQGQAKASKRNGSYFDAQTGMIAGTKQYLHTALNYSGLDKELQRINKCHTLADFHDQIHDGKQHASGKLEYSHPQRNYAMVCRDGLTFSGTLGAENCTVEEIAALLLLLDHQQGGHGFKIGMGKAFGLGSMTSTIRKVWLKKTALSPWELVTLSAPGSVLTGLQQKGKGTKLEDLQQKTAASSSWRSILSEEINGLETALNDLKTVQNALNQIDPRVKGPLRYPPPGNNYWKSFGQR